MTQTLLSTIDIVEQCRRLNPATRCATCNDPQRTQASSAMWPSSSYSFRELLQHLKRARYLDTSNGPSRCLNPHSPPHGHKSISRLGSRYRAERLVETAKYHQRLIPVRNRARNWKEGENNQFGIWPPLSYAFPKLMQIRT